MISTSRPRVSRAGNQPINWSGLNHDLALFAAETGILLEDVRVLLCVAHGMTNEAIGNELGIDFHAAKYRVKRVIKQLKVDDRAAAVWAACRMGLVDVFDRAAA